jgi:hypothetical protein
VISLRAGTLAVTICLLIALAADKPPPPLPQNAPLCRQPIWNHLGHEIGGRFVPCEILDRYEIA